MYLENLEEIFFKLLTDVILMNDNQIQVTHMTEIANFNMEFWYDI